MIVWIDDTNTQLIGSVLGANMSDPALAAALAAKANLSGTSLQLTSTSYEYFPATQNQDTIGDKRLKSDGTWQRCTVANATLGAGTWINDSYYGGFYSYNKAIPFNITVAGTYHAFCLISAGDIVTGLISGFTFNAGRIVDANITSEASGTGTKLRIVCSAIHGLTTGSLVIIGNANNAAHNKPTRVIIDGTNPTTEFLCDDITYTAGAGDSAATVTIPAFLQADAGSGGIYNAQLTIDGTATGQNKYWKWELNKNVTALDNIVTERLSTSSLTSVATTGNISVVAGDRIWISGKNSTDTTDYSVKNMNLNLHRI